MIKLKLTRALRKKLKQGHPWVYKDAFKVIKGDSRGKASFASLVDSKGEVVKGIYDPKSSLGFRSLFFKSLNEQELFLELQKAYRIRNAFNKDETNSYRLIAGEGDGFSGLICDVYDGVVVFQCDGPSIEEFWLSLQMPKLILKLSDEFKSVVLKSREDKKTLKLLAGEELSSEVLSFKENGVLFETNLSKAQKTGFFLDQRDNREYVKHISKGKEVWNIFSYTGGFSVYAGVGGAKKVYSVDISKGAIEQANINWKLNDLDPKLHEGVACDAFEFLKSEKKLKTDLLIVDPPSMTSSKDSKAVAFKKYVTLFSDAARQVKRNGDLILSSCSSQISFEDFKEVVSEALSQANRKGRVLKVSGQGLDHPYPHACEELRYLKFMHLYLD